MHSTTRIQTQNSKNHVSTIGFKKAIGELVPPFGWVASSRRGSSKPIGCSVRFKHVLDVDWAEPFTTRYARTRVLKRMLATTATVSGVVWENFGWLKTSRAVAFWMSCRDQMALVGRPARRELQLSRREMTRTCAVFWVRRRRILLMLCNVYSIYTSELLQHCGQ